LYGEKERGMGNRADGRGGILQQCAELILLNM
jgi:hypothetical protein